ERTPEIPPSHRSTSNRTRSVLSRGSRHCCYRSAFGKVHRLRVSSGPPETRAASPSGHASSLSDVAKSLRPPSVLLLQSCGCSWRPYRHGCPPGLLRCASAHTKQGLRV